MKAYRNGELLADVNREKGILFINVERGESGSVYANYDAGYPLRKNGHVELIVGGKVFRLYPDPESSGSSAEYAWHVQEDDKRIIDSLKAGSKVTIEAMGLDPDSVGIPSVPQIEAPAALSNLTDKVSNHIGAN